MIMIPLPFVFAAACIWVAGQVWRADRRGKAYPVIALVLVATQFAVVGARLGYGWTILTPVQPVLGAVVPLTIWAAFARHRWWLHAAIVVGSLMLLVGLALIEVRLIDLWVALVSLGSAGALLVLRRRGEALLDWVVVGEQDRVRFWLTLAMLGLILSSATDALASVQVALGSGTQVGLLVAVAMLVAACGAVGLWAGRRESKAEQDDDAQLGPDFERVAAYVGAGAYADADLTLARIGRRLGLPSRRVSRAVNAGAGVNLSAYVNGHRVRAAQALLEETDEPVTQVMLRAGFQTKSNFNRAFLEGTGATPSAWRRGKRPPP